LYFANAGATIRLLQSLFIAGGPKCQNEMEVAAFSGFLPD
jgi:hypothetical protein